MTSYPSWLGTVRFFWCRLTLLSPPQCVLTSVHTYKDMVVQTVVGSLCARHLPCWGEGVRGQTPPLPFLIQPPPRSSAAPGKSLHATVPRFPRLPNAAGWIHLVWSLWESDGSCHAEGPAESLTQGASGTGVIDVPPEWPECT